MTHSERAELEKWIEIITEKAVEMGLDCYPTHFEVVPDHIIYELGSYSLPARFSHWTFGRDYHRQKTSYEYGMSKIYEIVFNTDPCQAFLFDSNSMLSHKLVVAHVLGHNDFFKNNVYFEHTDRRMIEKVRLHGSRIRRYEDEYGAMAVEEFLDAVLSIEEHFDISQTASFRRKPQVKSNEKQAIERTPVTEYDDLWDMMDVAEPVRPAPNQKFPLEPEKDLLGFLRDYSPDLAKWQRDVLGMMREEMLYFVPQMRTKILNEGWASYWHEKILTQLDLTAEEHLEFRKLHSGVLSPGSKMSLNPYYVGYNILRDIEKRWNGEGDPDYAEDDWQGQAFKRPTDQGLQKIFDIRRDESDISFLRKYLTKGLVERLDMYTYGLEEVNGEEMWVVQDTDWRSVRDTLIDGMTNFGIPVIMVEDGDYKRRGELLLSHAYDGKALDKEYTSRTLKYVQFLWKRPVHLRTLIDDETVLMSHDGEKFTVAPEK